jgi:glycerol kinase
MILSIDQGTTGSTAVLIDSSLAVVAKHNQEFPQIYPQPGWVEHNPEDIWSSVETAVSGALAKAGISASEITAIGITNQRETTVVWDRATSAPIRNAIVWQCRRTTETCAALKKAGHEPNVREKTGLVLDPYFSGTKLSWTLDAVDGARARAQRGELAFGTIDSFLVWRLTGGVTHVTDVSNASRTMLMNLRTGEWDDELIALLRAERALLPEIRGNAEVYGHTKGLSFLPDGIPIAGMAGDQQAALFGQACFLPGEAKCTYGTGAFLLMNTGSTPIASKNGLLTTAAWRIGGQMTYALEGSAFVAGAVVQWLRDELQFFESAEEIEAMAASVADNGGVVCVPALAGLGAPHWNPEARGVIWGLTRGTNRGHIARAALEGIALQNRDILEAMEADLGDGNGLGLLRVDGGAAANNMLMQFQADVLDVPVSRPTMLETTALGAGLLAGLGAGVFSDLEAVRSVWSEDQRFEPQMSSQDRDAAVALWNAGLARV